MQTQITPILSATKLLNAYKKWKQTHKDYYMRKYRLSRNLYKSKLYNSQKKKENALLLSNKSGLYLLVKNKLKSKHTIKTLELTDNTLTSDRALIAEEFNKYFNSVYDTKNFENIDINIDQHDKIIISRTQCKSSVQLLRRSKGCGIDGIPILFWTNTVEFINDHLSKLFTMFCNNRFIQEIWQINIIRPLYKRKGNTNTMKNYRPIWNLWTLLRVFEKSIFPILENATKSKFSNLQYGFTKSRSTINNLLDCYSYTYKRLDQKLPNNIITVDFAKAFDKVNFKHLLEKCLNFGISYSMVGLLKCFLYNRKQIVIIEDNRSSELPITSGVPQGSSLSPILFKIYIDDLFKETFNHKILGFVDDIKHSEILE